MKKKEVLLKEEEIKGLLQGTVYWSDIEAKTVISRSSGFRQLGEPIQKPVESNKSNSDSTNYNIINNNDTVNNSDVMDSSDTTNNSLKGHFVAFLLIMIGLLTVGTWLFYVL